MSDKLLTLLEPSAICLHLDAKNAREVITQLGTCLCKAGYVHDSFVEAALERESHLPTGLPLMGEVNAAIPHTDVVHVIKPGLAMATLNSPVSFRNMVLPDEEVQVRLVFVMALDQPKAQVEMLQEIATILQHPEVIDLLTRADNYQDVCSALSSALN